MVKHESVLKTSSTRLHTKFDNNATIYLCGNGHENDIFSHFKATTESNRFWRSSNHDYTLTNQRRDFKTIENNDEDYFSHLWAITTKRNHSIPNQLYLTVHLIRATIMCDMNWISFKDDGPTPGERTHTGTDAHTPSMIASGRTGIKHIFFIFETKFSICARTGHGR